MTDTAPASAPVRSRLAIVGFGRVARDYLRILVEIDGYDVVGVVDPDPASREAAAAQSGAPTFASVDELLEAVRADTAIVATPPASHAGATVRLLESGCHVFCEKPLATTLDDADAMFDAAERHGRTLMMASKFRFVDDVVAARSVIDAGTIGRPVFYRNAFCSVVPMASRWNADPALAGGGVLFDNGTHAIDLARFLLGPIDRVTAAFGPRVQPLAVEDSARVLFTTTRDAAVGAIDLSWSLDAGSEHFVELQGTAGTLQIGWRSSRFRRHTDAEWTPFGSGYDKLAAFRAQLVHLFEVSQRRESATPTREDSIASVGFLEAAYRSAEVGGWIAVESQNAARPSGLRREGPC